MTPEALQLYKLIILYFLNKADQPMPNAILSDFILESGYTDYLSIQQTLSELTEDKMILVEQTLQKSYYTIAEIGKETLRFFGNRAASCVRVLQIRTGFAVEGQRLVERERNVFYSAARKRAEHDRSDAHVLSCLLFVFEIGILFVDDFERFTYRAVQNVA